MKAIYENPSPMIDRNHRLSWKDRLFCLIMFLAILTIALNIYKNERIENKKTDVGAPDIEHNINL